VGYRCTFIPWRRVLILLHEGRIFPCRVSFDLVVLVWSVFTCLYCVSVCMFLSHIFCSVEIYFLSVVSECL
jgi:hypothetical protein